MGEDEWDNAHAAGETAWSRTCENATRLSLLYACSENHEDPVIGLPAVEWATAFAMHQVRRQLHMAAAYVAENPFHALCLNLLRKLKEAPDRRMGHSKLLKRMHMKAADFRELIHTLIQQGEIKEVTTPRTGSAKVEYQAL